MSSPSLAPMSNWKTLATDDTINRLEEEEQNWLQQNRRNNNNIFRGMESCSQPSSPTQNYSEFGLKFWKWKISLKIPALSGGGSHNKFHDLHEQYGPHHCPLKKKDKKEEDGFITVGSKRDSQWEFFGFGNGSKLDRGSAKQAIRNRAKSIANIYYKPIDDQEEYDGDTEDESESNGIEVKQSTNGGEPIYAEIEDDDLQFPTECNIFSRSAPEDRVCMEPLPSIQHVTKIKVPPLPPKSPVRRHFLAPQDATNSNPPPIQLLPPYPSSVAARKFKRKSLNIDKVDGKIKRRHSVKN